MFLNILNIYRLVEEFMLLANMAVAHKIYGAYPAKALLRRHPTPQSKMMDDLVRSRKLASDNDYVD